MTVQLVGATFGGAVSNLTGSYECISKYTATATGTLTEIHAVIAGACNVMVGIYADASGSAGALLGVSASTAVTTGSPAVIAMPAVAIVSGTAYWLATNHDGAQGTGVSDNQAGSLSYKALAYGSAFYDPAGSGWAGLANNLMLQGWGLTTSVKTIDGLAVASVKTIDGLAVASVKTLDGLA